MSEYEVRGVSIALRRWIAEQAKREKITQAQLLAKMAEAYIVNERS